MNKEASAAPDAGSAMLAQSEHDSSCKYCAALAEVNDPEEGDCQYCIRNEVPIDSMATCKYCSASESTGSDCQYCNRTELSSESECKYCNNMSSNTGPAGVPCEYCSANPQVKNPTTTDSQDFAGQDLNSPEIPKPIPGEDIQGQITPMDDTTNNNILLDNNAQNSDGVLLNNPEESVQIDQSKEAMISIASQIENDSNNIGINVGPGPHGSEQAINTDEASLISGTNIVDGTSHVEDYASNTPGDMALDENDTSIAPDLTSVLQEGLDTHADNIQREKVIQMVYQALTGFKSCKNIIERAQTQAPQLYNSSIMMLKAMIEMAKMLGLSSEEENVNNPTNEWSDPFPLHPDQGGSSSPEQSNDQPSVASQTANEWNNPFPTHPENGNSAVGQPIGKLPTSATTQHVARVPLAPGSVNSQGQKKYVDPETGKESFIDMKEGRVLNNKGKPVKPNNG